MSGNSVYPFKIFAVVLLISGVLSAGCASYNTYPSIAQIEANIEAETMKCQTGLANAEFGKKPSNYKAVIGEYMKKVLIDSGSAQYLWDDALGPARGYAYDAREAKCMGFGWAVCVPINGKNRYGGYTGYRQNFFLIRDGQVAFSDDGNGSISLNCAGFADQTLR